MKKYRLTTTLARLRKHGACIVDCWNHRYHDYWFDDLLQSLGPKWHEHRSINLLHLLEPLGAWRTCWCFRATVQDSTIPRVLIAADMAQSVLKYFTEKNPNDKRPARAIRAARAFAAGKIDETVACCAAKKADWAGDHACYAADPAWAASYAAYTTVDAEDLYSTSYHGAAASINTVPCGSTNADYDAAKQKERAKQARIIRKWLK